MSKKKDHYPYKDITVEVADDAIVNLKVEFPDSGTTGYTFINVPGDDDKDITNAGIVVIGKGEDLKKSITIISSNPYNIAQHVNKIRVNFYLNDKLIVEHSNDKSESKKPQIIIVVNFK
jgi:hypothetical protein